MIFSVGQLIVYPNHGVGTIENIEHKQIGQNTLAMYQLRLAFNNSTVLVPIDNAREIGLRLPVSPPECEELIAALGRDFNDIPADWKIRHRLYSAAVRNGALVEVVDVFKKLTFLSRQKPLSFREQRLLEKARYLVISEIAAVCDKESCDVTEQIDHALAAACAKHQRHAQLHKTVVVH